MGGFLLGEEVNSMNRYLESGYGSPQFPEVFGDVQHARKNREIDAYFPQLLDEVDVLRVPATRDTNALGEMMVTDCIYQKDPILSPEQNMLNAYRKAYPEALQDLQDVENTGLLPDGLGAELIFTREDGSYFTSTAVSRTQAVYEAVLFQASQNQ